jgi:CBS domain-containing protein
MMREHRRRRESAANASLTSGLDRATVSPGGATVSLRVSMILDRKGTDVHTIRADAMLLAAADALREHNIGALVVSADGASVDGIVSERDVVRHLARYGTGAVKRTVADVMTSDVTTCEMETTVDELSALMTQRRIRHVPVVQDQRLVGIVSIGDVLKARLDELEVRNSTLEEYVTGRG